MTSLSGGGFVSYILYPISRRGNVIPERRIDHNRLESGIFFLDRERRVAKYIPTEFTDTIYHFSAWPMV